MKKAFLSFLAVSAMLLISSCSSDDEPNPNGIPTTKSIEFTAAENATNDALNDFSTEFLNTAIGLAEPSSNVCVSPLSAAICMSMVANSADAATEQAVLDIIHQKDLSVLNSTVNRLMRFLPNNEDGSELLLANSAWITPAITPTDAWSSNIRETFFSSVGSIDKNTAKEIDKWCKNHTRGMIPSLDLKISDATRMVLANVLYFKGRWNDVFDEDITTNRTFSGAHGKKDVKTMHKNANMVCHGGENYIAVELGIGNNSAIFILPDEGFSPETVAKTLDLKELVGGLNKSINVSLYLPKFNISGTIDDEVFKKLGIPDVSVLSKLGCTELAKRIVTQKTAISIDEGGAVIAAATDDIENLTSNISDLKWIKLDFNRPFLFLFRNGKTGTILLSGIVNDI